MTPPPDVKLAELLCELFDVDELQRFLRSQHREIADTLPVGLGRVPLAYAAAEALARRNLIDDALFARLRVERPRCGPQITTAARLYHQATARRVRSRRTRALSLLAAAGGAAGLAAFVFTRGPAGEPECATDRCVDERPRPAPAPVSPAPAAPTRPSCRAGMVLIAHPEVGPLCLDRSEVTRGDFCSFAPAAARCSGDAPTHPITHVRPPEAAAYCEARGLRLPARDEFARILRLELGARSLAAVLPAMNVCGEECVPGPDRHDLDFVHRDPHVRTAPVGSYRHTFASPLGLDDMFGNVREIVSDAGRPFTCGAGWANAQLVDLAPEQCLAPENRPLTATFAAQTVGFRCAGDPTTAPR